MKPTSDRQKRFDAAMAEIAVLPVEQQMDALLNFFTTILRELPTATIKRKRNELMERFSNCGCSFETCSTLLELVDFHVTRREQFAARQEAEARRIAKGSQRSSPNGIALAPAFARKEAGPIRRRPGER